MRYDIWDKVSPVITPIGEVLTAAQWIERYPLAGLDSVKVVCAHGEVNGAFFGTLSQMVEMAEEEGADFSGAVTDREKLDVIEEWENRVPEDTGESTAEERIASALETQVLLSMSTVNDDDPDEEEEL